MTVEKGARKPYPFCFQHTYFLCVHCTPVTVAAQRGVKIANPGPALEEQTYKGLSTTHKENGSHGNRGTKQRERLLILLVGFREISTDKVIAILKIKDSV